jgi:excisionase family DNA binding protein
MEIGIMTTTELQKITGINGQTLRRMFEKKLLPTKRPPHGHWRISKQNVDEIITRLTQFGLIEPSAKMKERARK